MFGQVRVWPPISRFVFAMSVWPFVSGRVIYEQKTIMIGAHVKNIIVPTVVSLHNSLDIDYILNSDN